MSKSTTTSKKPSKRSGRRAISQEELWARNIAELDSNFIVDEDGCWIWQGNYFSNGYGRLKGRVAEGLHCRPHIANFMRVHGPVPEGKMVCHECDKRGCINPKCLWAGTNQENQQDAVKKGVFTRLWTTELRAKYSAMYKGEGNPMYGRRGALAPASGRIGPKHPMWGRKHSEETKLKISNSLRAKKGL